MSLKKYNKLQLIYHGTPVQDTGRQTDRYKKLPYGLYNTLSKYLKSSAWISIIQQALKMRPLLVELMNIRLKT